MDQTTVVLLLGLVLGFQHALEADHVVAVSTIVTEQKNPFKSALLGAFWGMGHTTTLFVVGIAVLLFRISIPQQLSLIFEFFVGIMLVFLGVKVLLESQKNMHSHIHKHDQLEHEHPHNEHEFKKHRHHKSFIVGSIHGMAGSGALMLLVLSTIKSASEGLYYILLFGLGSIAGMSMMSLIVGLPFIYSSRKFPQAEKYLKTIAGVLSIGFGIFLMYEIGVVEELFVQQ